LFTANILLGADVNGSWDANTESDLAGYRIYYGTESGNYTQTIDVGNELSALIIISETNKTYYFAITAYDTSGNESGFSQEVSLFVPPPPDTEAPSAPQNVRIQLAN